ncbi:glycoside hydrolase [Massarina eburnea CBS 473.64]|uniref:Glycoside hydrolase n=1 Tax=Massarina eburnea CBS 473.64 TaxID=1395130 RepID=A0A6A6S1Y7_9PLEO|nr:glycoside hydrolase [Massarina eburnea CBS 473.64]
MHSLSLLALLPLVSAHGHVRNVLADSKWYTGWDSAYKYQTPIPTTVGWQADNLDNGFVAPDAFATVDIVCHKSAKSNGAYVTANAGSKVTFYWDTWPVSHKGPVINYIASCNGDCDTVTPSSLLWTKLDQGGWISGSNPGTWVTDTLVSSNFSASTTIPANLKAGSYVIRHEIIALHSAGSTNGAQAYPQCVNFKIGGSGTASLSGGVAATSFYKADDPGILFNLYTAFTSYTIPGPAVGTIKKREEREHSRKFL